MFSLLLAGGAALAFLWPQVWPVLLRYATWEAVKRINVRYIAAALLLAAALSAIPTGQTEGQPEIAPPKTNAIDLDGIFVGPTASADAATVGALCTELAHELEWDGMDERKIGGGCTADDLRRRLFLFRCRGVSIGDRQPKAREAIAEYMLAVIGDDGGPFAPDGDSSGEPAKGSRAAWVKALRTVGRAATDAAH